jgi:hypothetical protein
MWQELASACQLVWMWLRYEVAVHPFVFLGIALIIILAWVLYKAEVRAR